MECCFIGHRKVKDREKVCATVTEIVRDMIVNRGVTVFLFGSKSEFNDLCHEVVTSFMKDCPLIERVVYTCKSESFVLESEREKLQALKNLISNDKSELLAFEKEREYQGKFVAGKASYIERNQAMIDDSDYCVFCYDECSCLKNSGTKRAYEYAVRKKKVIFNVLS